MKTNNSIFILILAIIFQITLNQSLLAQNLINNPSFTNGWNHWSRIHDGASTQAVVTGAWTGSTPIPAPTLGGNTFAFAGAQTGPSRNIFYQSFTAPSSGLHIEFDLSINNTGTGFTTPLSLEYVGIDNQQIRVDLIRGSASIYSVSSSDVISMIRRTEVGSSNSHGWIRVSVTIPSSTMQPHFGNTVTLRFAQVDNQGPFGMGFTNVLVQATPPPNPTSISASANPICNGASTQLTANGAQGTVYWYTSSCGSGYLTTGNPINVSPSSTTTYYARNYANGLFSPGCANITITVAAQPTAPGLTKNPNVAEVCAGQTLTVSTSPGSGGTGTVTDQYRFSTNNGDSWSSWSTSVPNFAAVAGTNIIESRRTATGAGCTTSGINEVSWTVVAQPTAPGLTKVPTDAEVCAGQTLTVSATAGSGGTGTVTDEYRYSTDNGGTWSDWSTSVPSFAAVEGTNFIESRRTATGTGCNTSGTNEVSWTVVAQPTAPGLTKVPTDAEVCAGQTLTMSATAGSGGTGTVTDQYRYSTNNGDSWSAWSTEVPSFAAVVGTNIIESRRTATGTGCNESSYNQVSWTVVAQPSAPGLTKNPDEATVCEGEFLTVNTTPGTGGAGSIVDEYSYSTDGGTTWGAWTTSVPEFAAVFGNTNMIRSRRIADGPGCDESSYNSVSWEVEPLPVAGTLTPSPLCPLVHTGMDVAATHSGSAGGNDNDQLEYRTNDGTTWSDWLAYTSGDNISTTGLSMVEIQNQRLADFCAPSLVSVSWEVGNTRARNLTKEWEYFTVAEALADDDKLDPGDEILIRLGIITDTFTTDGKGGLSFFFGESICPVTINGSATFSADDRLNVRLDDLGHNKIAVLDNLHLNNATLNVIVDGNAPPAGTAYTIFTSPNNPGEFSNPSLVKTNGHQFILSYEEENGKWNVVLTSLAPLFKLEIRHIDSPR